MYNYEELRAAALAPTATKEDRLALYEWFEHNDMSAWNGEYFDADDGIRVYPIYDEEGDGNFNLVDADIR